MAKVQKVDNKPQSKEIEKEEMKEEEQKPVEAKDNKLEVAYQQAMEGGARLEGMEAAVLEMSQALDDLKSSVHECNARLDNEKEVRLKVGKNTLLNMPAEKLSGMILEVVMAKFVEQQANSFDNLREHPRVLKEEVKKLVQLHNLFSKAMEEVLREA